MKRKWNKSKEECTMKTKRGAFVTDAIESALLELLCEKSYLDITVTDLTAKAEVARVSFYRNYDSIDDVMEQAVKRTLQGLLDEGVMVLLSDNKREWRRFIFRYIYRVSDSIHKIITMKSENLSVIFSKINNINLEEVLPLKADMKKKYMIIGRLAFISAVIQKWLDDGCEESPEEIVDILVVAILRDES